MYDGCFGLNGRPFVSVPRIDHYFAATTIENARTTLARCIQRGEGAGLIIGPSGTGKTLLCLLLAEQFRRSFNVVMLNSGRLSTRRALFQAILYELSKPYRGMDEGELRLAVIDYLMADESDAQGIVVLVDEAHTLPLRLIEELRLLTNLVRGGQPLVRLILAGSPALEERFASPKLDSFSQRLAARCYLEALNRTESRDYIQSQMSLVVGQGDLIFSEESCDSVFQATGGVPRLMNQLCDHALLLAYVAGRQRIEPAHVEEAWSDLQQLPTPWNGEPKSVETTGGGVIEFGTLDSEPDTEPIASDVTASLPSLRISPSEEESEINEGEPDEQIHRIEKLLAEVDEDFQPAGSIGPEVELNFEEPFHPFQDSFEQEEVVADRYAPTTAAPSPDQGETTEAAHPPLSQEEIEEAEVATNETPSPDTAAQEPDWAFASAPISMPSCYPLDEKEAIVQTIPTTAMPAPSKTSPPRREYRQLFARLRRG